MSDEYRWNGEKDEKIEKNDGSQDHEGQSSGYYQVNQENRTESKKPGAAQESQNVTYHYSYRKEENSNRESYGNTGHRSASSAGQGRYGAYQEYPRYTSRMGVPKPPAPPENRKKGNGKKFGMTITLAVIFGLIAGGVFQGVNRLTDHFFPQNSSSELSHTETVESGSDDSSSASEFSSGSAYTVADVAKSAMPSVVAITAVSVQELPNFFGFGSQEYDSVSSGSGIIVGENDTELLIATNNHVVEGANNLSVCFIGDEVMNPDETQQQMSNEGLDTENAVAAKTKGTDASNDLAVIAVKKSDIPAETMSEIKIAQQGDAENLVVGEQVVAIGNAMGYGQSVTSGYVSALDRTIDQSGSSLIQTDAAINPGNSGGALLNMKGELIGINSAKFVDSTVEGMGFAIPITTAAPILDKLMAQETRDVVDADEMGYMGIQPLDISSEMIQMYDMPQGVFVSAVIEDTAAEKAGMKKGDIITEIEGQTMTTRAELMDKLQYYKAGETIEVIVQRSDSGEYKEMTLKVTLGEKPKE